MINSANFVWLRRLLLTESWKCRVDGFIILRPSFFVQTSGNEILHNDVMKSHTAYVFDPPLLNDRGTQTCLYGYSVLYFGEDSTNRPGI